MYQKKYLIFEWKGVEKRKKRIGKETDLEGYQGITLFWKNM